MSEPRIPSIAGFILWVAMSWGCAPIVLAEDESVAQYPWTSYFGVHYRQRTWARSIRSYAGPRSAGITFPSASPIGPGVSFEGLRGVDTVIMNIGGLGSGRNNSALAAFMDAVEEDEGRGWRKAVRQRAMEYARKQNSPGPELYWQFGNEINSEQFSRAFHLWAGDDARIRAHDPVTVSWYVEYFLAPGLAAIAEAERELSIPGHSINVVLGSIAVARNPDAQRWMEMLLEYRIKGDYAQELQGKYVWEVVDTVSIHYLVGTPGPEWEKFLKRFHDKWIKSGRIKAIWSTEEIGIRKARSGHGAGTAAKVWARYLHWWLKMGIPPERGKVFLWGSDKGGNKTSADGFLEVLYQYFGDAPLREIESAVLSSADGELEYFRYASTIMPSKQVVIVFPRERTGGTLGFVPLSREGQCDNLKTSFWHLSPEGSINKDADVDKLDGQFVVRFDKPLTLSFATAAVFLVESADETCKRAD